MRIAGRAAFGPERPKNTGADTYWRRRVPYELYYWPSIQGRGEFVRLALEEAGAAYVDVWREGGSPCDADSAETPLLRAALPEGRKEGDRPDGQHPALSRRQARARAEKRGRAPLDAPDPAHHRRPRSRGARHPPSARRRLLLRGPEAGVAPPGEAVPREPHSEIPRLVRDDPYSATRRATRISSAPGSRQRTCRCSRWSRASPTPFRRR